jgi:hypothetical protein
MPVRRWANTPASFRVSLSYSCRVCLPGSAMSTFLECFPTFSGSDLTASCLARAILRVVDRILGSCICGIAPCRVAAFAFSLANFKSSFSSLDASHKTFNVFPSLCNALTIWYTRQTCPCPDCCRGCLIVSAADLLLVSNIIFRYLRLGRRVRAVAMAVNSPEYGF